MAETNQEIPTPEINDAVVLAIWIMCDSEKLISKKNNVGGYEFIFRNKNTKNLHKVTVHRHAETTVEPIDDPDTILELSKLVRNHTIGR